MRITAAAFAVLLIASLASAQAVRAESRNFDWIALSTDIMPGPADFPNNPGPGNRLWLADDTTDIVLAGDWWRNGRNFGTGSRGDYSERQRPRVFVTAPTGAGLVVDGADVVTITADVEVPNDAASAISDVGIDTYAWSADPDVGSFADDSAQDTTWTAPAATAVEQVVTLTLSATENYTVALGGNITGSGAATLTVNATP